MASKYKDYLAAQILSEGVIINYRNLSRALNVHVNIAKQMLYEFHRIQNGKRPGSVHATYLICGARKAEESQTNAVHPQQNGADVEMGDAFMSSSLPEPESQSPSDDILITSVTLVVEEQLQAIKAQYSRIDSIHVYSLEPGPIKNIQLLSDCTRRLVEASAKDDPFETWKQYGTIHNPNAKRRSGVKPPQPPQRPPPSGPSKPAQSDKGPSNASSSGTKPTESNRPVSSEKDSGKNDSKASKAPAQKRDSSSLFKSFAKTKPPEAKRDESTSESSSRVENAKTDEEEMKDSSGDEDSELAALPEASKENKEKVDSEKKAKAEREARLREMMEEEEEEEESKPDVDEGMSVYFKDSFLYMLTLVPGIDIEMEDVAEQQAAVASSTKTEPEQVAQETKVTTASGRRRGRRRVMKKKHFKDAEGYMVTKEEPVWESFSEDEAPPPSKSKKPTASLSNAKSAKDDKSKKSGGKPGQGNIMKFFGKG